MIAWRLLSLRRPLEPSLSGVDAGFASAQIALGFDIRSELSELPLQVVTVAPRDTAFQIVEPDLHRGEVTLAGGQSPDHFVELTLDAAPDGLP